MAGDEIDGMSNDELYDFMKRCVLKDDCNILQIKTTDEANLFLRVCKNFSGASIMKFRYDSGKSTPRQLHKTNNNIKLILGANVFLPDLRYGETYSYAIEMTFEDVIDFTFIPEVIEKSNEIRIEEFKIDEECCTFSCFSNADKSKIIKIKSKKIFVENFIDSEEEQYNSCVATAKEKANMLYKQKKYDECICILKNEYPSFETDSYANNLMGLCYSSLGDLYEAIRYVNKAIEIDPRRAIFYYNKALYLKCSNLALDALKCFNIGISLTNNQEKKLLFTKGIIDLVNDKTQLYTVSSLSDSKSFEEYIYYFNSIIDLDLCFPELKEKFVQYREEAISYFFNEQKFYLDSWITQNYSELANNLEALLKIKDLNEIIRCEVQDYLERCKFNFDAEKERVQIRNELGIYISDLFTKGYSDKEILKLSKEKFPNASSLDISDIIYMKETKISD